MTRAKRAAALRRAIATTLEWIDQRTGPGEGISEATRVELRAARQVLVEGCRERGVELERRTS